MTNEEFDMFVEKGRSEGYISKGPCIYDDCNGEMVNEDDICFACYQCYRSVDSDTYYAWIGGATITFED